MSSDWCTELANRWNVLGRELPGLDATPRRSPADLTREHQSLVVIAAWLETREKITQAALLLGSSRRALRERFVEWQRRHPLFVPIHRQERLVLVPPRCRQGNPDAADPDAPREAAEVLATDRSKRARPTARSVPRATLDALAEPIWQRCRRRAQE
jgi:hypothetical protein